MIPFNVFFIFFYRNGISLVEAMKWIGEIRVLCYRNRECLFGVIRFYLDVILIHFF